MELRKIINRRLKHMKNESDNTYKKFIYMIIDKRNL